VTDGGAPVGGVTGNGTNGLGVELVAEPVNGALLVDALPVVAAFDAAAATLPPSNDVVLWQPLQSTPL